MGLLVLSQVQQRLGLVDDSAAETAMILRYTGSAGTPTYTASSTQFILLIDGSPVATFDLTSTSRDTMQELASGIEAVTDWDVTLAVPNTTASGLLTAGTGVAMPQVVVGVYEATITYSNTAAGTSSAVLSALIAEVEASIYRYCGVDSFGYEAARDEYYDGTGHPVLCLRHYPVRAITSIKWLDSVGNETAYAATDYRLDEASGRVRLIGGWPYSFEGTSCGWPRGWRNLHVVYEGGYYRMAGDDPTEDIPADLESVALDMVTDLYLSRRTSGRVQSESMGDRNVSYRSVDDLLKLHAARLAPYVRKVPVA